MIKFIKSITIYDIIQLTFAVLLTMFLLSIFGCTSIQNAGNVASYQQTEEELINISDDDNLTPAQKIIIKHAAADLKDAQAQGKQTAKLREQVIKASEKAGAGKLVYNIMYFVAFLVAAFLGFKILKKFSLF